MDLCTWTVSGKLAFYFNLNILTWNINSSHTKRLRCKIEIFIFWHRSNFPCKLWRLKWTKAKFLTFKGLYEEASKQKVYPANTLRLQAIEMTLVLLKLNAKEKPNAAKSLNSDMIRQEVNRYNNIWVKHETFKTNFKLFSPRWNRLRSLTLSNTLLPKRTFFKWTLVN